MEKSAIFTSSKIQNLKESKIHFPHVQIKNEGPVTEVYVDGTKLAGVESVKFVHDPKHSANHQPTLEIRLLTEKITIDAPVGPSLPEIYHPAYVSSWKLVEAGIITLDELNQLVMDGLL